MWTYKAIVTDVYDADTITVDVDLGFHAGLNNIKIRLFGINAPEVRGVERPEGLVSRDWLRDQILGHEIVIRTYKNGTGKGKYGRWLADIYRHELTGESINQELIRRGLAVAASY